MGIFAALAPLAKGAVKAGAGAAISGGISKLFGGKAKTTTYDPYSLYSPEQMQSIRILESLASTGSGGGITLGERYSGDLGYHQQTPGELQALSGIQGLIGGQDISGARDVFSRMADHKFDPDDPSSGYAAFSRALAKAGAESADVLNREAAITGSRFWTGIQRQKASLAGDLANQRGMFLADLFSRGEDRAMQGAHGLQGLVGTQQNLFQELASQAAIERLLKDKQVKEQYLEFERARGEEMERLGLMKDQWMNPMGLRTKTSAVPTGFSSMISSAFTPMIKGGIEQSVGGIESILSKLFSKKTGSIPETSYA